MRATPAAFGLLLLLIAPLGQAAGLSLTIEDILNDLPPGGAGSDLVIHLSAQCSDVLPLMPTSPKVTFTTANMSQDLVLAGDVGPAVPFDDCQAGPTGTLTWDHRLNLSAKAAAPGLQTLNGTLTATITRPAMAALSGDANFRARVAYVGDLVIEVGTPEYNATSKVGVVRIAVTNQGNAKTTAAFQIDAPSGELTGPSDLVLPPKSAGAENRQVATFEFVPPEDKWTTADFEIVVRGHAFGSIALQVAPQTVNVTFTNNAQPKKDAPAPAMLMLAPGLLAVAWVVRRRD